MSTIKQKSAFIEIEGGKRIEVRRMRWRSMRDFLRALAKVVATVYPSQSSAPALPVGMALFAKLPELVAGSDELVTLLCTGSTDLSLEDFANLDSLSACQVLAESIKLNCDDELKNCLAGIAESVAGLIQQPAPTKQQPAGTTTP
jgi:hypothetical protein